MDMQFEELVVQIIPSDKMTMTVIVQNKFFRRIKQVFEMSM